METGVLERIRGFEADIEKCVESVVQQELFSAGVTNERHRILLDHFKLSQVEIIRNLADKLLDVYLDEDDIVEAQQAPSKSEKDVADAVIKFEGRVADIREYHLTYRNLPSVKNTLAIPDPKILETLFSVNERYGRCLDLEAHYKQFSGFMISTTTTAGAANPSEDASTAARLDDMRTRMAAWAAAWPSRPEYFRFVPDLPEIMVSSVDATRKLVGFASYRSFVEDLLQYLKDFYQRVHPLNTEDTPRVLAEATQTCEEFWAALVQEKDEVKVISEAYGKSSNSEEDSAEEEEGHRERTRRRGARLPHGTKASCGLSVPPPLKKYMKSFSMWPLSLAEGLIAYRRDTEAALTAENAKGDETTTLATLVAQLPSSIAEIREVCITEAKISLMLRSLLFDVLQQTEKTILRDYSKTMEELELDRARADREFADSLELVRRNSSNSLEGTAMSYAVAQQSLASQVAALTAGTGLGSRGITPTPIAVPQTDGSAGGDTKPADLADSLVNEKFIGEDGTPIPRWLIQLQQLEKTFVCEVCGGTVYQGPKVFREHFGQERHTEGLRRLGVAQNLREFEGISSIRAAIEMRDQLGNVHGNLRKRLREDKDLEEIQDEQGHVLTNRQYMSLQQRGRPM